MPHRTSSHHKSRRSSSSAHRPRAAALPSHPAEASSRAAAGGAAAGVAAAAAGGASASCRPSTRPLTRWRSVSSCWRLADPPSAWTASCRWACFFILPSKVSAWRVCNCWAVPSARTAARRCAQQAGREDAGPGVCHAQRGSGGAECGASWPPPAPHPAWAATVLNHRNCRIPATPTNRPHPHRRLPAHLGWTWRSPLPPT